MNDSVIDIFSLCRFFFKFGGNLTSRWYLHSPPSRRRRMENTINYQIIIFLINFTTKFEEEPHGIKIIPTKKYFSGTN